MPHQAKCLCKAVTVTAQTIDLKMGACHCGMCRKWTGGPFFATECGSGVTFDGQEHLGVYASSDWAERGFCKTCGTHLFYRLKDKNFYALSVGLFDGIKDFVFDHQIFIDEKPACYAFANQTRDMTGAEVFAKFS